MKLSVLLLFAATLTSSSMASAQVDLLSEPSGGTHTLASGFTPDPASFEVIGGGVNAASESSDAGGQPCSAGWIDSAPSVRINYTAPTDLPLVFYVDTGGVDPTLAVNAPDGSWHCNDDWHSLMPRVHFEDPAEGRYDVFVGSYTEGTTPSVTLVVTEVISNTAQN